MARIRRLDRIHRKRSNRVYRELVNRKSLRRFGHGFEPLLFRRHLFGRPCGFAGETFCTAHNSSCVSNYAQTVKQKFIHANILEQKLTRRVVARIAD
jgi:hypothetical protein